MLIFYEAAVFGSQFIKVLSYPRSPVFDLAPQQKARLILYRKDDGLELWRLGSAVGNMSVGNNLPINTPPVKILDMELTKVFMGYYCK